MLTPRFFDISEWVLAIAVLFFFGVMSFFGLGANFGTLSAIVTIFGGLALVFVHGVRRYGWRLLVFFFVVTWVVSNIFENLSILTGFPFGHYIYTGEPKIFLVTWFIGLTYFIFGYSAWTLSTILLERADTHLNLKSTPGKVNLFLLPLTSAVVMTLWDLGMDSQSSTIDHRWIWRDGGAFFGVGAKNYFGWVFVTWLFFQIFTLTLAVLQTRTIGGLSPVKPTQSAAAIVPYFATGIAAIGTYISSRGITSTVRDGGGTVWKESDIYTSMMLISVLTVVALSVIGLGKIIRGDEKRTVE